MRMDAQDVRQAVAASRALLDPAADRDWTVPAGDLDLSVAEVVAHIGETLLWYATDLAAGGPELAVMDARVIADASPHELLTGLTAFAEVLTAVIEAAPPGARGYHSQGLADTSGFAAMACDEILVHTDDAAHGLGLVFEPDVHLTHRVLTRLFPDAPRGDRSWPTLRWANGRCALADHPRRTEWRWHSAPHTGGPL